jgi:hypothetical protein
MAYESGGIISAKDYNNLLNDTNKFNTTWSTGSGDAGYGQTAITTKSAGDVVTATEWASLINKLNIVRTHQTGAGTGVSAVVSGDLVEYQSGVSGGVDLAYTNRTAFSAQGSTTTDAGTTHTINDADGLGSYSFTRTATFSSGDAARYFFNAGGELNFVLTAGSNTNGTGRTAQMLAIVTACGGVQDFRASTNGGRTGTGETETTNDLTIGYYDLTTSNQTISRVDESGAAYTPYTGDWISVAVKSNGVQGSNADKGTIITWTITYNLGTTGTNASTPPADGGYTVSAYNDACNGNFTSKVNVTYPETASGLSNTWGSVTIG